MSSNNKIEDIIIMGAGAAGISVAWNLRKLGLDPLILDKGKAGNSWRNMPGHLKIISPWKTNSIDFDKTRYSNSSDNRMDSVVYADYLDEFCNENELRVESEVEIASTTKEKGRFKLVTNKGERYCNILINATGYFSNPWFPENRVKNNSLHFADFTTAQDLPGNPQKVLVVGKRLSAGQLVEELLAAGIKVGLSTTGPVKFFPRPFLFRIFFPLIPLFDRIHMLLKGKRGKADINMEGEKARKAIASGEVRVLPLINKQEDDIIEFEDGYKEPFDLIIYATGFRPALSHLQPLAPFVIATGLKDDFEHPDVENLFFLGLDMQCDYRSRFLRGMREDGIKLARLIYRRSTCF